MNKKVYLDYAATTYLRPEVLRAMLPFMGEVYGNPASVHLFGQKTRYALERARAVMSGVLNACPDEIYFTSGGTESNNWAIRGITAGYTRGRIITSQIEHPAVLNTCKELQKKGFDVVYLPVDEYGVVSLGALKNKLTCDTVLVSVMAANNEIGTIEPIADIGRIVKACSDAYFHVDAVQAAGALDIRNYKLPQVDMTSLSAHKFYGPQGIGALYIKKGTRIHSFVTGGSQERGMRAGTSNVAGAVGMSKALELAAAEQPRESRRLSALRERLIGRVLGIDGARLNGHPVKRLPNNANFSFDFVEGESLMIGLNTKGFAVSAGSACSSESREPSHVLLAIGLSPKAAHSSCRITMGRSTRLSDIDDFTDALACVISDLRADGRDGKRR
ncbi:MAG: cysteine desulfurase family protein [Christensenellales bacterium]